MFEELDDGVQHLRDGQVVRWEVQVTFAAGAFEAGHLVGAGFCCPVTASLAAVHRRGLRVEENQDFWSARQRPQVTDAGMFLRHQPRSGEPLRAQSGHKRSLARCTWAYDDNVQLTARSLVQ